MYAVYLGALSKTFVRFVVTYVIHYFYLGSSNCVSNELYFTCVHTPEIVFPNTCRNFKTKMVYLTVYIWQMLFLKSFANIQ